MIFTNLSGWIEDNNNIDILRILPKQQLYIPSNGLLNSSDSNNFFTFEIDFATNYFKTIDENVAFYNEKSIPTYYEISSEKFKGLAAHTVYY